MDATQLTLLLSSRLHSSARTATAVGDDALGQSKAFAEMLDKHIATRAEERKAELSRQQDQDRHRTDRQASDRQTADRQTADRPSWRNTSAPLDSHQTDDTTTVADDALPAHPEPAGKSTTAHQASVKKSDTASDASTGDGDVSMPRKVPTQHEKTTTKNANNPEHPGTVVAKQTADQADDKTDAAVTVATGIIITKQDVPLSQLPHQGGEGMPGDGSQGGAGNQQQDGSSQGDDGKTAAAEAVEATMLASLIMPQTTTAATGAGAAIAAAAGIPATPVAGDSKAAATGTDGAAGTAAASQALATAAAALQNNTAQAAQALAASLTAPGSSGAAPIAGLPGTTPTTGMSTAPTLPGTALGSVADAESSFTNAVTKKLETATTAQDNVRITATRATSDNSVQMPRPLVRVEDSKSLQASVQPAATVAPSEAVTTTASETALAPIDAQSDYLGDTLHSYSPFSALMPGGIATAAARQADALTVLRQQLANMSVQDQVSVHIQRAIRDSVDKISIQLSPTELGHIHVKMNVDDDKQVSATITVERPATLELLQRDTKALERALQEAGLKADSGSLSFSLQRGNQDNSSDTPGWGRNGRQIGSSGQENSAATTEVSSLGAGNQVDTANGVVNVAV